MKLIRSAPLTGGGTVSGDLTVEGDFVVEGGGSLTVDSAVSTTLRISSTGTSAAAKLELVPGTSQAGEIKFFQDDASTVDAIIASPEGTQDLVIYTGASEAMRILNTGEVGIGTATPYGQLHCSDASGGNLILSREDDTILDVETLGILYFGGLDDGGTSYGLGAYIKAAAAEDWDEGTAEGTDLELATTPIGGTSSLPRMTILDSGNVGIGTSAPAMPLEVSSGDAITARFTRTGSSGGGIQIWSSAERYAQIGYVYATNVMHLGPYGKTDALILDGNSHVSLSNNDSGGAGGSGSSGVSNNTVFGYKAGEDIASGGVDNTLIGHDAGKNITTGNYNVVLGSLAGDGLTTASYNTVLGHDALGNATTAVDQNTVIGRGAMSGAIETADVNACVAIGDAALAGSLTSGASGTVVIGKDALAALTSGAGNTAIGYQAMITNIDGSYNTAIGYESLYTFEADSADHGQNTALGYQTGKFVSTGTGNTFLGFYAGIGVSDSGGGAGTGHLTGDNNTAVGRQAGLELEGAAHSNTFVGNNAGSTTEAGVENTCIGSSCLAQDDTATNQIVIGNNVTGTADNAVHIGNDTSHIRCDFNADEDWDASSDVRHKKDIEPIDIGLAFINDLKPSKYRYKSPSEFPEEWEAYDADDKEPMGGSDEYHYGFIAQEIKEVVDQYNVSDYKVWSVDPDGRQRVSKTRMITTLVKAVQELSAEVEELKNK